jgi:AmmeMemoRadiSam system protein A
LRIKPRVGTLKAMHDKYLTLDEKKQLLSLARHAILAWCGLPGDPPSLSERIRIEKRGAFVTLRQGTELRGCIGFVEPVESIGEAVRQLAVKSASEDPRFSSIHQSEVNDLTIEISILTPLAACEGPGEVVIGRHGLVVEKEGNRGLLLPEVATEAGWDPLTFLEYTCRKAGLPPSAWNADGAFRRS